MPEVGQPQVPRSGLVTHRCHHCQSIAVLELKQVKGRSCNHCGYPFSENRTVPVFSDELDWNEYSTQASDT